MTPDMPSGQIPAAHPSGRIAPLFWQAMRGAASLPHPESTEAISEEELAESLPLMWDAIWQAAGGHEPKLAPCPPASHSRHLLDNVRRAFIALIRSVDGDVPVQEVVRVLDAIERVQSAVEKDAAIKPLRESAKGQSGMDLVVEVAQELRSPLSSILFLAETLRGSRGAPLRPPQVRQLKLISSAAFELSCIVNDLGALAQGGEQLLEREPAAFAVRSVLQSVRDTVQPVAEEKGVEVRLVEPGAEHRIGHPAALGRVLLNLVTNALRSTNEGFVEITAQGLSPTRLEFAVCDSGPGVPDDVIASLFQPFDPLRPAGSRSFSSSGLGLAISRRLITAMGGDLRVRPAPDRGSCFYFALELPAEAAEPEQISPAEHSGGRALFDAQTGTAGVNAEAR